MPDYLDKLSATRASYPFERWARRNPERYHPAVRAAFAGIFDRLLADLAAKGEAAPEEQKLEAFHQAVEALKNQPSSSDHNPLG